MIENTIRDVRESKNISQRTACDALGLSFSTYERIEKGSPRTTEAEIKSVLAGLRKIKKSDKVLAGRPFDDPKIQKAVAEARANGESVSAVLAKLKPAPVAKEKAEPTESKPKKAPAKKAAAKDAPAPKRVRPPRSKAAKTEAAPAPETPAAAVAEDEAALI